MEAAAEVDDVAMMDAIESKGKDYTTDGWVGVSVRERGETARVDASDARRREGERAKGEKESKEGRVSS